MASSIEPPLLHASSALFLDFDGTLAPIAPRPQDARAPVWAQPTLQALSTWLAGAVAIVSGRPIAQLDALLDPLRLASAGLHGAEWRTAAGGIGARIEAPPAGVLACAAELAARHPGLIVEPKAAGLSLHFRARPELESICGEALVAALAAVPGVGDSWEWLRGHFVFELKQRAVSKGVALTTLHAQPPFAGRKPVFVGDDVTDEDGILAAQAAGGYGVRVGTGASQARYRLADTEAVGAWLRAALQSAQMQDKESHGA